MSSGGEMERSFIPGEPSRRPIMSTRCGRIGISWTLRQRVGRTFRRRHRISGLNSWRNTICTRSSWTNPGEEHAQQTQAPVPRRQGEARCAQTDPPRRRPRAAPTPPLVAAGTPQVARADGADPVQAYIAAMPGWKRDVGRRLDGLIVRTLPGVRKAGKGNSPFSGMDGPGWVLNFHCFTKYVKVAFFRGASLRPVPPGESKHKDGRYLDIYEDDRLNEALGASWIRQASELPGWVP